MPSSVSLHVLSEVDAVAPGNWIGSYEVEVAIHEIEVNMSVNGGLVTTSTRACGAGP